ncbi:MAG: arginine--tRNA ligase [Deltaproteobacteria bacterium]|nr:arginine--tRNA ligase [Deltaproteobacteria bacterium]
MKQKLKKIIIEAAATAQNSGDLPPADFPEIEIEEPKIDSHGDFSTNLAMILASSLKMPPRKIAEAIFKQIKDPDGILSGTEIAGPGFINFFMETHFWYPFLRRVHDEGDRYGASDVGKGEKIQVEFVSANPTGPLHIGHGRGAAVGDSVANILGFSGYDVEKEYYINDSGRQIYTLGRSVFLRYKAPFGEDIAYPDDCYQGEYIQDYAAEISAENDRALLDMTEEDAVLFCARFAAEIILAGIREDLEDFGVEYDRWYSEQSLYDSGRVEKVISDYRTQNMIYEKDGALWFRTTEFGDEKDRVVVRNNGQTTYFASDIAYHQEKFERGFHRVIDVWGADHHGYIPRVTAFVEASGRQRDQFNVILVQLVNLLRGGEPVAMSTRAGEFITLRDVIREVGRDAARFIFLTRHYESPLDFDLELAKQKTNDNPVFYVQYVHARISSISRKARENGTPHPVWDDDIVKRLQAPEEIHLIKTMARYPEVVEGSAETMEPHRITFYLMNLAAAFHAYYNKHRVLTDEPELTRGRLYMVLAVQKVIRNGLALLGVSAPERM